MSYEYCPSCRRKMTFKRNIGIGTLLAFIMTGGLWIFMIPSYPKRCIGCGKKSDSIIKKVYNMADDFDKKHGI